MEIKARLNLTLFFVAIAAISISGSVLYNLQIEQALEEVKRDSIQQMRTAQAVRSFTAEHVRKGLLKDETEFHPASVPSFAANTTMRYLQEAYPGYKYQEVALNPMNPENQAKGWTKDIVDRFRTGEVDSIFMTLGEGANQTFNYALPLKVSAASCLTCHSTPEVAPATQIQKYGTVHGFGWRKDEIIGAQIVSVPAHLAITKAQATFTHYLAGISALFLAMFIALNAMLRRVIVRPVLATNDSLKKMAFEDPLTCVANRRCLMEHAEMLINKTHQNGHALTLLMIDLDHFKRVNDNFGHAVGDAVLKEFAIRIGQRIRSSDLLGRVGGEEFAIILPQINEAEGATIARQLLIASSSAPYNAAGHVTASIGVAQYVHHESLIEFVARADAALYTAKKNGRNRVVLASHEAPNSPKPAPTPIPEAPAESEETKENAAPKVEPKTEPEA